MRLNQFWMALHDNVELVQASLLDRNPLCTLDVAIVELLFKKTHKQIMKTHPTDMIITTTPFLKSSSNGFSSI